MSGKKLMQQVAKERKRKANVPKTGVPRLLRIREVAEITHLEKWRIYELLRRGDGPRFLRVGRTFRVPEDVLIAWIDERAKKDHSGEN